MQMMPFPVVKFLSISCLLIGYLGAVAGCGWSGKASTEVASSTGSDVADPASGPLELVVQTINPAEIKLRALNADGTLLATVSQNDTVSSKNAIATIWNVETGQKLRSFTLDSGCNRIALNGDGSLLACGGHSNTPLLWDTQTGILLRSLSGHTRGGALTGMTNLHFCVAGTRLFSSTSGEAILWNVETGKALKTFRTEGNAATTDDARLVVVASNNIAKILSVDSGAEVRSFRYKNPLEGIGITGDGRILLTKSFDGITLWDARTGQIIEQLGAGAFSLQGFSGDLSLLERMLPKWDSEVSRFLQMDEHSFYGAAISGKGNCLALGGIAHVAQVCDLERLKKRILNPRNIKQVKEISLTPDGRHLVIRSESERCFSSEDFVWDLDQGRKIRSFAPTSDCEDSLLAPDGLSWVKRTKLGVSIWNVQTGELKRQIRMPLTERMHSISLNNQFLVTTAQGLVTLWRFDSGTKVHSYSVGDDVPRSSVFFAAIVNVSQDGKWLTTSSLRRKKVALWNIETGLLKKEWVAPEGDTIGFASSCRGGEGLLVTLHSLAKGEPPRGRIIALDVASGNVTDIGSWFGVSAPYVSHDRTALLLDSVSEKSVIDLESAKRITFQSSGKIVGTVGQKYVVTEDQTRRSVFDFRSGIHLRDLPLPGAPEYTDEALWNVDSGDQIGIFGKPDWLKIPQLRAVRTDLRREIRIAPHGSVIIRDLTNGKLLCSLSSFAGSDDWLVTTPEGLFDGSVDATRLISYRIPKTNEFVPLERYQQNYWSPGLLAKIWAGHKPAPSVDVAKSLPPTVRFSDSLTSGLRLESSRLTVSVTGKSRSGFPIQSFQLLIDGRPYRGDAGKSPVSHPTLTEQTAQWEVELDPGSHRLKVLANTAFVQGVSPEIQVISGDGTGPEIQRPSLFFLGIGIGKHQVPFRSLDYARNDAEELAKAFQTHSHRLYRKVETHIVVDEQATNDGILRGLQWLRDRMASEAAAVGIVFFAGHGEADPKDGLLYLLPSNSVENDFAGSAINAESFKQHLAAIPGKLWLILDSCHAGKILSGKTRGNDLTHQLLRDLTAEEHGLTVLCGALDTQRAVESRQHRHGLLTQALLEAISGQGNGLNGDDAIPLSKIDGAVYLSAIHAYVNARVRQLSRGEQTPVNGTASYIRDFPLSKP